MAPPRAPVFLERQSYRRRRLIDAARVLPVAGLVALLLPVLWSGDGQTSTAAEAVYMFAVWLVLIVAAGLLSRPLRSAIDREATPGPNPETGPATGPATDPAADPGTGPGTGPGTRPGTDTDMPRLPDR